MINEPGVFDVVSRVKEFNLARARSRLGKSTVGSSVLNDLRQGLSRAVRMTLPVLKGRITTSREKHSGYYRRITVARSKRDIPVRTRWVSAPFGKSTKLPERGCRTSIPGSEDQGPTYGLWRVTL